MRAEFRPRHGDIRVFTDEQRYGDPYVWCSSMQVFSDGKSAEIGPYEKKISLSVWKALVKMCASMGIERVLAVTYPQGAGGPRKERWITIPTLAQQFYKDDFSDEIDRERESDLEDE
jgi:hypothetical protein